MIQSNGFNFSMGLAQINYHNLSKYQLNFEQVFDPCTNLSTGSKIYGDCFDRASRKFSNSIKSMKAAFSCYYSGNFKRGFIPDKPNNPSYVQKVSTRYFAIKSSI